MSGWRLDPILLKPIRKKWSYDMGVRSRNVPVVFGEYFEDYTEWTANANGAVADEATLVRDYQTNKKSVKLTATGSTTCNMLKNYADPKPDVRGTDMIVSLYIDPAITSSNLTEVKIYLISGAVTTLPITLDLSSGINIRDNGWILLRCPITAGAEVANEQTGWSALARIQVTLTYPSGQTPNVILDSIEFVEKQQTKAHYCFTCDDGLAGLYTAGIYLSQKGIRGTFFVIPSLVGTAGYVTLEQLRILKARGHLIANHGYESLYLTTGTLTPYEAHDDIRKGAEWLEDNGFAEGMSIFAVPGGTSQLAGWGEDPTKLMSLCDLIRMTAQSPYGQDYYFQYGYTKLVYPVAFDSAAGAAAAITARKLATNPLVCTGWHGNLNGAVVDADGVLKSAFTDHIDAVAAAVNAGTLECITIDELV